jgi:hypothetical protein
MGFAVVAALGRDEERYPWCSCSLCRNATPAEFEAVRLKYADRC